jgi:hypothetical protein
MGVADTPDSKPPAQAGLCSVLGLCGCTLSSDIGAPPPRSRTSLGVGETVRVAVSSGRASWTVAGAGTLVSQGATWAKIVAGEVAGTFTVTANMSGWSGAYSCSLTFTVYAPEALMKKVLKTAHKKDVPGCGFVAKLYLLPVTVSFEMVVVREIDSIATEAWGFYASYAGSGHRPPGEPVSPEMNVLTPEDGWGSTLDTHGASYDDKIVSGDPRSNKADPPTEGKVSLPFSFQYRVSTGTTWYQIVGEPQTFHMDATGQCIAAKAGADAMAEWHDKDSGFF